MLDIHALNIITHILAGSLAIVTGAIVLARRKGDTAHRMTGWITVGLAVTCLVAALIGAFVFRGKLDLMGVSILTSYHLWAGLRALRLKDNGRRPADLLPALLIFLCGAGLFAASRIEGMLNWAPALVYAAAGGLVTYGGWDLLRTLLPLQWRTWLNPAEHALRMASLIGALVTVAAATLIPSPYVALGASTAGAIMAFVFAFRAARKALGVVPSAALKARLNADSEL